jgi:hypothetical protein
MWGLNFEGQEVGRIFFIAKYYKRDTKKKGKKRHDAKNKEKIRKRSKKLWIHSPPQRLFTS